MKERENIDKYKDLAREIKKETVEHEGNSDTNCNWSTGNISQKLARKPERIGNQSLVYFFFMAYQPSWVI